MFSYDLTLNEFVCFIPICPPEADLESILKIFQQTNCSSVAIPQAQNRWGVVNSHQILSWLSKSGQEFSLALVNHSCQRIENNFLSSTAIFHLASLIEPVIVYQGDTSLSEFLSSLANNSVSLEQNQYLIVDSLGKLQGKLDQDKLLKYLALGLKQEREKVPVAVSTASAMVFNTISHELKSPLTGIVGLSSLLKEEKIGSLNQRQALYLQLIYNSGQKLMGIVNSLLELTNITTGKLEAKPRAINLKSFCYQIYQQALAKLALEKDSSSHWDAGDLTLEIEPEAAVATVDPCRLSIILLHLVQEAIKFSKLGKNSSLKVIVKNSSGETTIQVRNDLQELGNNAVNNSAKGEDVVSIKQDGGLNLIVAKYLATMIQGKIHSTYTANSCWFTLALAKNQTFDLVSPVQKSKQTAKNLTILCLYPEPEVINPQSKGDFGLDFNLKHWAEQDWSNRYRIIEADGLLQAHTLSRIWQLDVIVLDGHQIVDPQGYLRSLQDSETLSSLPLVTLDTKTTEAANQMEGLNVYPCLLPVGNRSIKDLMQVIQIATDN